MTKPVRMNLENVFIGVFRNCSQNNITETFRFLRLSGLFKLKVGEPLIAVPREGYFLQTGCCNLDMPSAESVSRYHHGKLTLDGRNNHQDYSLSTLLYRTYRTLARWFCDVTQCHVTLPFENFLVGRCACADDAIMTPGQTILHR